MRYSLVALAGRGGTPDFRDNFAVCQAGLASPREFWELLDRGRAADGGDVNPARARLVVPSHPAHIRQHRQIERIEDPGERGVAARVRAWLARKCVHALESGSGGPVDRWGSLPGHRDPATLGELTDQVNLLGRPVAAWGFGRLPDLRVVEEIRAPDWRAAVGACRLLNSPMNYL